MSFVVEDGKMQCIVCKDKFVYRADMLLHTLDHDEDTLKVHGIHPNRVSHNLNTLFDS